MITVMLSDLEDWLRHASPDVIAGLAAAAFDGPGQQATGQARGLIRDMRYYLAALASALSSTSCTCNGDGDGQAASRKEHT